MVHSLFRRHYVVTVVYYLISCYIRSKIFIYQDLGYLNSQFWLKGLNKVRRMATENRSKKKNKIKNLTKPVTEYNSVK